MGRLSRHYLREGIGFEDNPQTLWQQDYQYQADGELAKIVGNNARDYRYDEVGQLTSASYPEANQDHHHAHHVETFKYDVSGNRISDDNSATGNRLAFFGDRHFEYDRFGNLIAERRGTAHKLLTTYEYDCRHRLIKHTSPNGRVSTYTYDTFNRRTSKTVDGKKIEFIWQGNKLIAECSDKDTVWRSYLYEPDSFRPLALVEGNAKKNQKIKTYWYQNDHLGTPHSLTDSLGNLVYSCRYNAYGKLQEETQHRQEEFGIRVETNLRFQGQYWDEETGLHYNFNRYYDPDLGRYLTQDPIKLLGGLNKYRYCNNPINWIDPFGLINTNSSGTESVFYSVQSENDVNRLMSGGNPWPNKPTEAHIGEGVYTWGSQAEAESYLARLNNKEWAKDANLQVVEVKVSQTQYDSLKTFDMRNVSDDITNEWLGKHSSLYGKGEFHDFEHVIRPAGIGDEYYFSKSIFSLLKFEVN